MTDLVIAGRYRLEEQVGAGGMSEVWRATDLELERTVAVKLLAPDADPLRFEREARAVAALSHPNICGLYHYGETDGRPFMVLEYLPGGSLEDRLAGRPLRDEDTTRIASEIAAGLAHAHGRGIVHRDLKPSNILFDAEGRAKIADFGIARIGASAGTTEVGTVLGTAAYISPEQAAGREATPASDVYAFGVILFRMLTGRLPFESRDAIALAAMHRDEPPPAVSGFRPDAPARLESLAAAALAKSPADRPPNGAALLAELGGPARATGPEDAATHVVRPPKRKHKQTAVAIAVAVAIAAAGVALAAAVTFRGGETTTPTATTRPATARTRSTSTAVPLPPASTETVATSTPETTTAPPTTEPTTTAPVTTAPPITTLPTTTAAPPPPPPPPPTTTATTPATTEPPPTADTTPTATVATDTTATTPASPG